MQTLLKTKVSGSVGSLALNPAADRLAVAVGNDSVALFRVTEAELMPDGSIPLTPDRYKQPTDRSVKFRETKVGWLNPHVLLVGRAVDRSSPVPSSQLGDRLWANVIAVDLATQNITAEYDRPEEMVFWSAPQLATPDLLLVGLQQTIAAVDPATFRELALSRAVDDHGEPVDPEVNPDETLALNGFAYQPADATIVGLYRLHKQAILETCRFDPAAGRFVRLDRTILPTACDVNGLCANPGGVGVTAWLVQADQIIDLRQKPTRELPRTAQLGQVLVTGQSPPQTILVESAIDRDFHREPRSVVGPDGTSVLGGYALSVEPYPGEPTYVDDHRLALNTPGGLLLIVDTATGQTSVAGDFGSPIRALAADRPRGRLVVGCQDGTLCLLNTNS